MDRETLFCEIKAKSKKVPVTMKKLMVTGTFLTFLINYIVLEPG